MAGTNSTQAPVLGGPPVILVEPQLGENIGMAARAMLNCGLTELRLVKPRDGWPSDEAIAAASGADKILDAAQLFPSAEAAIADLQHVYATTARPRGMVKRILTPRFAAGRMRAQMALGQRCGLMFGAERMGLLNDHLALADTVISVPLNPAFASLNLAQAVLIVGYEWFHAADATPPQFLSGGGEAPAPKAELINFLVRLETELDDCGFLRNQEARPSMVRNLRNLFQRAGATDQELRTMHGVVKCLVEKRKDRP
ncbi:MAG: RNA methyltransferase [Alphaproteobacteria bacterium]|nr:RNA methyltransferase [Alphaproteobacteria bacterium]